MGARVIGNESIKAFEKYLLTEEKAENTVKKYNWRYVGLK